LSIEEGTPVIIVASFKTQVSWFQLG